MHPCFDIDPASRSSSSTSRTTSRTRRAASAWPAADAVDPGRSTARSRLARERRRRRRLHPGLAPGAHAALREGRRDLAGPLRRGHVGRRAPPRARGPGDAPIVRKGANGEDGYSGFTMRDPMTGETIPTELDALLRERGRRRGRRRPASRPTTASRRRRSTPSRSAIGRPLLDRRDRGRRPRSRATASARSRRCAAAGVRDLPARGCADRRAPQGHRARRCSVVAGGRRRSTAGSRSRRGANPPPALVDARVVDAPIERVWAVVADIARQPEWMRDMKSRPDRDTRAGRRRDARRRRRSGSSASRSSDPVEITEFEPPDRFAIRHDGLFSGDGLITLEPGADEHDDDRPLGRRPLVPPVLPHARRGRCRRPILRAVFQADLERLKRLVETGSAAGLTRAGPPRRRDLRAVPGALRAAAAGPRARRHRRCRASRGSSSSSCTCSARRARTHVGCATDRVIESFRNDLYPGYKSAAGMPPELLAQFPIAEEAIEALGIVLWPMVEFEADDAIAAAAVRFGADQRVERILICTPDKDMAQLRPRRADRAVGPAAGPRSTTTPASARSGASPPASDPGLAGARRRRGRRLSRGCPAGATSRPRRSSPRYGHFEEIPANGSGLGRRRAAATRSGSRRRCATTGPRRSCTATSPGCARPPTAWRSRSSDVDELEWRGRRPRRPGRRSATSGASTGCAPGRTAGARPEHAGRPRPERARSRLGALALRRLPGQPEQVRVVRRRRGARSRTRSSPSATSNHGPPVVSVTDGAGPLGDQPGGRDVPGRQPARLDERVEPAVRRRTRARAPPSPSCARRADRLADGARPGRDGPPGERHRDDVVGQLVLVRGADRDRASVVESTPGRPRSRRTSRPRIGSWMTPTAGTPSTTRPIETQKNGMPLA